MYTIIAIKTIDGVWEEFYENCTDDL
jgi:hypothetical protein